MSSTENGFLWGYRLAGEGERRLNWAEAQAWTPDQGPIWLHLDRRDPEVQSWLHDRSGVDAAICQTLLADETRPRSHCAPKGLLLILRGVNLNPGAEPDDMIALRIWADANRVISLRSRQFQATQEIAETIAVGTGPQDVGSLLTLLGLSLSARMEPVIENLEGIADALEEWMTTRGAKETRTELSEFRRQVIALRRYLSPQRLAIAQLVQEPFPAFSPANRASLRELADRTTRHVEDLEALRERAGVIHDELANHIAEQLNTRMYVVSLITTIFLPLGLLTGLLGINVGGMPGAQDPAAFGWVCAILVAVGAVFVVVFRWLKWL